MKQSANPLRAFWSDHVSRHDLVYLSPPDDPLECVEVLTRIAERIERSGGLLWTFDRNPVAVIEVELAPLESSLLLEARVLNRSENDLAQVNVQNCFHLSTAPDFACDDFSRIYIRTGGQWTALSSLEPTRDLTMYFRQGFIESRRTDSWGGDYRERCQSVRVDHPLIVCVSKDGNRSVGTASDDYECVFHNRQYLRCIHSQQASVPKLSPGATAVFRQRIYFVEGGLSDCISAFNTNHSLVLH